MERTIQKMSAAVGEILSDCRPSVYLYGSCVLNDFRLGWSDIDILVLTQKQITQAQAEILVNLRQTMQAGEPDNPYFGLFEGGMLTLSAFCSKGTDRVVYWGTSGQRVTDAYAFDSFCMAELMEKGRLLYGKDIRGLLKAPDYKELCRDILNHYEVIRRYAGSAGKNFRSFGWLFDIARSLYTLQTGKISSKTDAAQWTLERGLCPVPNALEKALEVRRDPLKYQKDSRILSFVQTLGPDIQRFNDVLGQELRAAY